MHFHFRAPALPEHGADRARRQLRSIAIAAQMSEHNALDFSAQQLLDHSRRCGVRKMTMPRLDSLFHRPRPMWIVLQHFLVVIRFDHERVHPPQSFHHHLRRAAEIGDEPETARARVKRVTDRIDRIVRDGERLHVNIADGKIRPGPEQAPVPMLRQHPAADRFRRERVAINRDLKFPAEHFEPANVIAVFVREEHAVKLRGSDSALREAEKNLARAQPAVDEKPAMIGRDERAISRAPAPKHRQTKHERLVADAVPFHKLEMG